MSLQGPLASYKLRTTLTSHSGDVRALAIARLNSDYIISGSRDKTALIWIEEQGKYSPEICLKVHQKYVSCVSWIPAFGQYSQGLVLTGSHDKTVNVFDIGSPNPRSSLYTLSGHNDAVSCIAAYQSGLIMTGSWDCTAKLWQDSFCIATLEGHELAVWAVEFVQNPAGDGDFFLVTGSADKTVRTWSKTGAALKILRGHTDVVRGLVSPRPSELLSCANDATIRHWDVLSGDCLMIYYGHTNYIYSISLLGSGGFITSSEDASVRIWEFKKQDALQTIRIPTRSIWAVASLRNGDIVAGGSDGHVRIFTTDPSRMASEDILKAFDVELATMEHSTKEVLDGIKSEDLQNETALLAPGTKDGQMKIIRRNNNVEVYNWNAAENEWKKIGDVVGSTGGDSKSSGRTVYMGKEYDYVFSVDFDESKPPVKLPYNMTDDPWHVAQKFLHDNELPQSYLDTVAKFIMQNAPGAGTVAAATSSQFADPFTGTGRYVPGATTASNPNFSAADPFTGSGRYVPGSATAPDGVSQNLVDPFTGASSYRTAAAGSLPTSSPIANSAYPVREYLIFRQANVDGLLKKLKENFESEAVEVPRNVTEAFMELMKPEVNVSRPPTFDELNVLGRSLDFPEHKIFPALDLLRLAIRHPAVCEYFCGPERSSFFIDFILPLVRSGKIAANQQLSLKILSNIFVGGNVGTEFMFDRRSDILAAAVESASSGTDKNVQVGRSTLIFNYAVLFELKNQMQERLQLLYAASEIAKAPNALTDGEAIYRFFVAIGTLLSGNVDELKGYAKALDLPVTCAVLASNSIDERVKSVLKHLDKDFK